MTALAQETLRLEAPLRYLARHPGASLAQVALVFRHLGPALKDDLQAWLEKHNHNSADLTEPALDAVKQQSGTLVVRAAPHPIPTSTHSPMKTKDETTTANTGATAPWLKLTRKIKKATLAKYRPRLEAMARGEPRPGKEGSWLGFLRKNLGAARADAAAVREFLRWLDAGGVDGAERAVATKVAPTVDPRHSAHYWPIPDSPPAIAVTDGNPAAPVQLVRIVVEVRIVTRVEQG